MKHGGNGSGSESFILRRKMRCDDMSGRKVHYATIKDVAKLAGTSSATVSYVLNGDSNKSLRQETVDRVMEAVKELNYSKSAVASTLRGKRRGMVFVLIPQFNNIYYTRVCESIEDVLFDSDIIPVFCDTRENPERERYLIESAVCQRVDGIIMGPTSMGWDNTSAVRRLNIPLVSIGREFICDEGPENTYFVGDDSYQAGFLGGRVLVKNGHRRIGVVDWNGEVTSSRDRRRGFDDAIRESFNKDVEVLRESSNLLDIETGYQLTRTLLQKSKPTALFYGYHRLAQGGISYLQETGINVPEDISVVLVGTPVWADLSATPYTVINQHEDWVGTTAGRIMASLINGGAQPLLSEHRHVCQCSLVEHKSVRDVSSLR